MVEHLYRLCCMCQALDPGNAKHQLATRMRGVFAQYVVEMGVKVIEDRRAEVTKHHVVNLNVPRTSSMSKYLI